MRPQKHEPASPIPSRPELHQSPLAAASSHLHLWHVPDLKRKGQPREQEAASLRKPLAPPVRPSPCRPPTMDACPYAASGAGRPPPLRRQRMAGRASPHCCYSSPSPPLSADGKAVDTLPQIHVTVVGGCRQAVDIGLFPCLLVVSWPRRSRPTACPSQRSTTRGMDSYNDGGSAEMCYRFNGTTVQKTFHVSIQGCVRIKERGEGEE